MNDDPYFSDYILSDPVLTALYSHFADVALIPVPKGRAQPVNNAWKQFSLDQTLTLPHLRQLSQSNIGIACGPVSNHLCGIQCENEDAYNRFITNNPLLKDSLAVCGPYTWVAFVRILGLCPITEELGEYGWLAEGACVLVHNRDGFTQPVVITGENAVEIVFGDLNWEEPAKTTFQFKLAAAKHGPPQLPDDRGRSRPNFNFWGAFLAENSGLKFNPALKQFVRRNSDDQRWMVVPVEIVMREAQNLVLKFGWANDWKLLQRPFSNKDMNTLVDHMRFITAEEFADEANGLDAFIAQQVIHTPGADTTSEELFQAYGCFCQNEHLLALTQHEFFRVLPPRMKVRFGISPSHSLMREQGSKRGYRNVSLRPPEVFGTVGTLRTPVFK